MAGGGGGDTYVVDDAGDTVTELAGGGIDLVESASPSPSAPSSRTSSSPARAPSADRQPRQQDHRQRRGERALRARRQRPPRRRPRQGHAHRRRRPRLLRLRHPGRADECRPHRGLLHRDDTILLSRNDGYAAIGAKLTASEFVVGAKARDASDRIVWNPKSGVLLFDQNGSKAGGAVKIAILDKGLALDHTDFLMI